MGCVSFFGGKISLRITGENLAQSHILLGSWLLYCTTAERKCPSTSVKALQTILSTSVQNFQQVSSATVRWI